MRSDDNPSELRAKMVAMLALLDVLDGGLSQMSAVAIERVGPVGQYAGKLRLKFSVFAAESRTLAAADELLTVPSANLLAAVNDRLRRHDRILLATRMIAAWTDLIARLATTPALPPGDPDDVDAVHVALGPGQRRLPAGPG